MHKRIYWITGIVAAAISVALAASPAVFIPDATFHGSSLTGWHPLGQAKWRAENGQIVGTPGEGGGWLVLDKSYQDVGFFTSFRCASGCKTGVLLRAEKTPQGMKGIYLSLNDGDLAAYRVTLDAEGRELSRDALRPGGGQMRIAPPPAPAGGRGGRAAGGGRMPTPPGLPLKAPVSVYHADDWNQIEIILDANIIRSFFNDGNSSSSPTTHGLGGVADEEFGRYGPIALYAGGTGEVRFKDVSYKDLNAKTLPKEKVSPNFTMQRIDDFYYAWSAAAADVNRDGILDVVAGPYYWLGPSYTVRKEIYLAQTVNPSTAYPNDCMQAFAYDFTGDGWPDVLCMGAIGQPLHLYVNPKGESRRWDKYDVYRAGQQGSLAREGYRWRRQAGICLRRRRLPALCQARSGQSDRPLGVHTISEQGPWGAGHGIGVGDINGDGRMDVVDPYGWWEQPAAGSHQELWTYHPAGFRPLDRPCVTRRRRNGRL